MGEKIKMDNLRQLVVNFFKNLECEIDNSEILIISNVPPDFEKLYSKKGPYKLIFSNNQYYDGVEIINESSYLIVAISNYLKNKAKMTILSIFFEENLENKLRDLVNFGAYKIKNISSKIINDVIYKITFLTNFKYLNNDDKIINSLYLHDGEVIDNFDLEDYKTELGKKEDISGINFEKEIDAAKRLLRELIKPKIDEISTELFSYLEISKKRIDVHYEQIMTEYKEEIKKNNGKIIELKSIIHDDHDGDNEKILKYNESNINLSKKIDPTMINIEKEFHYEEEKLKNALNISSNIINKTLIYYPIHELSIELIQNGSLKTLKFSMNLLTKKIRNLDCECCGVAVRNIVMCNENHVICSDCEDKCNICYSDKCKKCLDFVCFECRNSVCSKCIKKCGICKKDYCSLHTKLDFIDDKIICNGCSMKCSSCGLFSSISYFRKIDSKNLCPKCVGMSINFYD